MKSKNVYEAFRENGLFTEIDHNEFSKGSCWVCDGKAGERFIVEGYLNLKDSDDEGNKYKLSLCVDCFEGLVFDGEGD